MKNTNKIPEFGELLNSAIQTIKNLSARNSITQAAFYKEFEKLAKISECHKQIVFVSNFDVRHEWDEGSSCYDEFIDLILLCTSAMGIIKEDTFNLIPNVNQNFAHFITHNEKVTVENIMHLDPFGKIYFWLAGRNFSYYVNDETLNNDYVANLNRFDKKAFTDLQKANLAAYGKNGDVLINHLIDETNRRTSLFMNNYRKVTTGSNVVKVTPDMIMAQLRSLTPLQFEWFCLKLVERSLEVESPESNLISQHTGRSNDNGLDGHIRQEYSNGEVHNYYIQAKLYNTGNNISNSDLRNFIGAYPPQKTNHHGLFITTTSFTKPAQDYAKNTDSHSLILIDQLNLIELMMQHKVGLKEVDAKPKLLLDNDFFEKIKLY